MQDGAPAHTCKSSIQMLEGHSRFLWSKNFWPGNSPDLNVIEHLWAVLQDSVFIDPRPTDRDPLIKRVTETWNRIDIGLLRKLVDSFPARIDDVINAEGGSTMY